MKPTLGPLLFSFKGRIGRQYWWLGLLAVSFVAGMLNSLVELVAKVTGNGAIDLDTQTFEPSAPFLLVMLAVGIVNAWISYALCTKRLHDRERSGWWLMAQVAVIFLAVGLAFGALALPEGERRPLLTVAAFVVAFAIAFGIWLFVELGFLKGTKGPNRYGPDPLAPGRDATA